MGPVKKEVLLEAVLGNRGQGYSFLERQPPASSLCSAVSLSFSFLPQDVEPSSPAALAGLCPYTDYVVGSDQILQEVRNPWRLFPGPLKGRGQMCCA